MIRDTNITATDIIRHLSALPGMTHEKAIELLDPGDKQNVPKAVSLIQSLLKLKKHPYDSDSHFDQQKRNHINFVAHFLGAFVLPFIDVEMSLSDQLKSLSQFAHLAGVLQLNHGSSCLTGALYADTQATVKNIFFTTARLQAIDPNLKFYIIHEGTDRLENLFSDCRTQDHARNFDVDELSGKLSAATLINAAFERNPDIKKPHRRLNLKDVTGIDRVNPQSWEGNTRVGDVDLQAVWKAGRDAANNALEEYFGTAARFAENLFATEGYDLQRPKGSYVGVNSTVDDIRSEEETSTLQSEFQVPHTPSESFTESIQARSDAIPSDPSLYDNQHPIPTSQIIPDDNFIDSNLIPGEGLEDLLSDNVDGTDEEPNDVAFSKTLEINGAVHLKSSLVASLTSNRAKKVTMRPLRAAGMAIEDLRQKSRFSDLGEDLEPDSGTVMKSMDLGAFLARCGGQICLAIVEIAGFRSEKGKSDMRAIESLEKIADSKSGITIIGQVIQIVESTANPGRWEWNGRHLSLNSNPVDNRMLKSLYVAEIPSYIVQPIHQHATPSVNEVTWSIDGSELQDALNGLWESLNPDCSDFLSNVDMLQEIKNPDDLPYRTRDGSYFLSLFLIKDVTEGVNL
jgi:hypothetical protein